MWATFAGAPVAHSEQVSGRPAAGMGVTSGLMGGEEPMRDHDVVIVGGGQAGLAMGHALAQRGLRFVILDAGPRVGHVWRSRWDSLRLFTPARYSALPGLAFPGDPESYPGKEAVADYLERYASEFSLPVRHNEAVQSLRSLPAGGFEVQTPSALYRAEQVVIATGPFQRPWLPTLEGVIDPGILQLHSSEYRNPARLPAGEVLVVGGGNSGVQIAAELARTHPTSLAIGERLTRLPQRLLGRSLFWWLESTGLIRVSVDSGFGRRASRREVLIGTGPETLAGELGVRLLPRVVRSAGDRLYCEGDEVVRPSSIVWATGFRSEYGWVHAPVFDAGGRPVHARGVTAVRGLYFLGLSWLHTRGSALLGWVGRDAEFLATRIMSIKAGSDVPVSARGEPSAL